MNGRIGESRSHAPRGTEEPDILATISISRQEDRMNGYGRPGEFRSPAEHDAADASRPWFGGDPRSTARRVRGEPTR